MVNRFTSKSQQALHNAKTCAEKMGHTYIGSEHLLLGLLNTECVASKLLSDKKITYQQGYDKVVEISGVGSFSNLSVNELTPKCKKIIERSSVCAKKFNSKFIGTEHILYAICDDGESVALRILVGLGINLHILKNEIATFLDNSCDISKADKQEIPSAPILSLYSKNLNTLAKEGKLDPLVCRDNELERLIQVLCRRTKNNPCLIGEPGVGKTAIVEGLALKIVDGDVPDILSDKIVVSLDLSSMIAGAKYRGEFEERMKGILAELRACDNLILFIDEIHTLVGAGAAEGAVDAANIIKPALARSALQLIGATTTCEYRKYIEKDPALERRFQPIIINEPSKENAFKMLLAIAPKYEEHHGVKIENDAILSAIELSSRYINDRFLPDKAIDLIDEACSHVKMKHYEKAPFLKNYERKIQELDRLKEEAIIDGDFTLASLIRDDEIIQKIEYNKSKAKHEKRIQERIGVVSSKDIINIVEKWTGIPLITNGDELKELEQSLLKKIIGQDLAIKKLCSSIKRGRIGLKNPNKPVGSFLFLGPTGVGKTELAKALAFALFGSENALVRIDMSEYMEKHSVSKLIGAPSGYIGYEDGGILTEAVRRKPYSVILFDELEKAHHDIYNILLQILDDGILTDSFGRTIDFKNTIIILTSNIGINVGSQGRLAGFSPNENDTELQIKKALKNEFSPEFINRLDEIIIFKSLELSDIEKIAKIMTNEIKHMAKEIGIELDFDELSIAHIAKNGYSKEYGARYLRRYIISAIENELSEMILNNEISKGQSILITVQNEKIKFLDKEKSVSN